MDMRTAIVVIVYSTAVYWPPCGLVEHMWMRSMFDTIGSCEGNAHDNFGSMVPEQYSFFLSSWIYN